MKAGNRVLDEGYILDAESRQGPRRVCTFTSLCRLRDGTVLATYRLGSAKDSADGNCQVARSEDGGLSWEVICEEFESSLDGVPGEIRSANLAQSDDGSLLAFLTWIEQRTDDPRMYVPETDTPKLRKLIQVESEDGGCTWSEGRVLDTEPLTRPVLSGPILRLPGKGWLLPVENYAAEKEGGPSLHSTHALLTGDGRNIDRVLTVARHTEDRLYYWDQRQALCPDGQQLVSLFWTYDRKREQDVDIHISGASLESLSWRTPIGTGIRGQIAVPIPLPDNRLLAFYVLRELPGSLRLVTSVDGGRTWDRGNELVVYRQRSNRHSDQPQDYAGTWKQMSQWTFGHPAAVTLGKQVLLVAYYAGMDERRLSARWARIRI